jgi:hypothetical protein
MLNLEHHSRPTLLFSIYLHYFSAVQTRTSLNIELKQRLELNTKPIQLQTGTKHAAGIRSVAHKGAENCAAERANIVFSLRTAETHFNYTLVLKGARFASLYRRHHKANGIRVGC